MNTTTDIKKRAELDPGDAVAQAALERETQRREPVIRFVDVVSGDEHEVFWADFRAVVVNRHLLEQVFGDTVVIADARIAEREQCSTTLETVDGEGNVYAVDHPDALATLDDGDALFVLDEGAGLWWLSELVEGN